MHPTVHHLAEVATRAAAVQVPQHRVGTVRRSVRVRVDDAIVDLGTAAVRVGVALAAIGHRRGAGLHHSGAPPGQVPSA